MSQDQYGQNPQNQSSAAQSASEQTSAGANQYDQAQYGQSQYEQGQYDQSPYGQGAYGQNEVGSGSHAQGDYSQGDYSQGGYSQNPYSQDPYSQGGYLGGGMVGPTSQNADRITLNYWLSLFFSWIPALIFFLQETGDRNAKRLHGANMGFQIVRVIVALALYIPFLNLIALCLCPLLAVVQIVAAVQAPTIYRQGQVEQWWFTRYFGWLR